MVETKKFENVQKNLEQKNQASFLRDSYIVGDSLSVGITSQYKGFDGDVKGGMQTSWMLNQVEKNIFKMKNEGKKVLFLLGGTNDVFSNKTSEQIIKNIDAIAQLAKNNGLKIVVGTIPPFTSSSNTVQKALGKLNTTSEKLFSVINEVNNHIKTKYDFIDYNQMLSDKNNPNMINPKFEAKNGGDGIHPFNGYKKMAEAQINKYVEIQNQNIFSDINSIISSLEESILFMEKRVSNVLGDMTEEQKAKVQEIINGKRDLLNDYKNILTKLSQSKAEFEIKQSKLSSYENSDLIDGEFKKSEEFIEIQNEISDLQKRILELDESYTILQKDFRLLSGNEKINSKLEQREIDEMQQISFRDFLKKPYEERLKYVTIGNIDSKDVAEGKVKDLEINFTFNGRFNRQVYLNTTAGMILPNEVREVESNGEKYFRSENALKGEFFTENGKRLIIKDETKISVTKLLTKEELENNFKSKIDKSLYKNPLELEIALEAEKRGIPEKVAIYLLLHLMDDIKPENQLAVLENLFVEIERTKGQYHRFSGKNWKNPDGRMSIDFITYVSEGNSELYKKLSKEYGYKDEEIKAGETNLKKYSPSSYNGKLDLEKLKSLEISQADIDRLRSKKRFEPNSKDAVLLFQVAGKIAGLPESWATNSNLHYILLRESGGKVGILNYTIKSMRLEEFKFKANNSTKNNPIGSKSTASGLGQLLLSNVDIYYPSGRKGIGDPIEEAVGFMNYIKDRYGNPDIARSVYGKKGYYNHPEKGRQYKGFKEGY